MKSMIRLLIVAAVVMAVALPAGATCNPAKTFASFNVVEESYLTRYLTFPADATNDSIVGRFWQKDNRAAANEGASTDSDWLIAYGAAGSFYINGNLGAIGAGCPSGNLITLVQNNAGTSSQFVLLNIDETPARSQTFDYTRIGTDFPSATIPRPRVTSSSGSGAAVNITVVVDSAAAGAFGPGAVDELAYQVVRTAARTSAPTLNAADFPTVLGTVTAGTPTPFTLDCSGGTGSYYVSTQLVVDGFAADIVSAPTRVNCDPTMADPKFKLIDKKPLKKGEAR